MSKRSSGQKNPRWLSGELPSCSAWRRAEACGCSANGGIVTSFGVVHPKLELQPRCSARVSRGAPCVVLCNVSKHEASSTLLTLLLLSGMASTEVFFPDQKNTSQDNKSFCLVAFFTVLLTNWRNINQSTEKRTFGSCNGSKSGLFQRHRHCPGLWF